MRRRVESMDRRRSGADAVCRAPRFCPAILVWRCRSRAHGSRPTDIGDWSSMLGVPAAARRRPRATTRSGATPYEVRCRARPRWRRIRRRLRDGRHPTADRIGRTATRRLPGARQMTASCDTAGRWLAAGRPGRARLWSSARVRVVVAWVSPSARDEKRPGWRCVPFRWPQPRLGALLLLFQLAPRPLDMSSRAASRIAVLAPGAQGPSTPR